MEIESKRFAIVSNGFADGPAQALRDYLVARGATVITVFHPLVPEAGNAHEITVYRDGKVMSRRARIFPLRPPLSFALDPFVPRRLPEVDVWFGFNSLACARGLVARRRGRAETVVHWCVDFVPQRFGRGPLTWIYDSLDKTCCRHADTRFELSVAARDARNARHGTLAPAAPVEIVPMGAGVDRVPKVADDAWRRRSVVFLGHLVERQGVDVFLEALAVLRARGVEVSATVIGGGPLEQELRRKSARLELTETVSFTGFVSDHGEVERLLAQASLAVAPYKPSAATFTRFADPGKLKAYVAAGLPVVLTDVPPNAAELATSGGAEVVPCDSVSFADAIENALADPSHWQARRRAALDYSRSFDWEVVLNRAVRAACLPTVAQ